MMRAASSFPNADREPTSQLERVNPIFVTECCRGLTQSKSESGMGLHFGGGWQCASSSGYLRWSLVPQLLYPRVHRIPERDAGNIAVEPIRT
jgi:hypothetical protein